MTRRRRSAPEEQSTSALRHVLVVGGTANDWVGFGVEAWRERVTTFAATIATFDAPWLTIRPYGGAFGPDDTQTLYADLVAATGGTVGSSGLVTTGIEGVTVLIAADGDGRQRIADTITELGQRGSPDAKIDEQVDEQVMVAALLAPSGVEPDLVVILGRPDRIPPSVVWELAYAEIVYLDLPWADLDATHLQLAVDDFRRRDRRFGGIDA